MLYLNSDLIERGFLDAEGSPSMQRLITEAGAGIHDPETGKTVLERLRARLRANAYSDSDDQVQKLAEAAASGVDVPIGALGSGSDFASFLQHLGIATLSVQYDGEGDDEGIYHSNYDSFDHYIRFGDPGFAYGLVESQTVGHVMLRVADADILPMQFSDLAGADAGYLKELHKLADGKREQSLKLGVLRRSRCSSSPPTRRGLSGRRPRRLDVPYLDFAPLDNAIERLKRSAKAYDDAYQHAAEMDLPLEATQRAELDRLLQGLEQTLTSDDGLPGRPWFKHLIDAPGIFTGYTAKTMPGVREAIEARRWDEAGQYIAITAGALEAYCQRLDTATALLHLH